MTSEAIVERLGSAPLIVAYFSIPGCTVCTVLRPKVESLISGYPDAEFLYIDSAAHPAVAGQHLVFAAPTILVFADGRKAARFARSVAVDDIAAVLDRLHPLIFG